MNNVLELKGKRFEQASKTSRGGGAAMNSRVIVTSERIFRLIERLNQLKNFWKNENQPFNGILVSVYYNKIVAKTNRISGIFKGEKSNYAIVGAKFNPNKTKHIITYFLDLSDLDESARLLYEAENILRLYFGGRISKEIFDNPGTVNAARLTGCKNISRATKTGTHEVYASDWDIKLTFPEQTEIPSNLDRKSVV